MTLRELNTCLKRYRITPIHGGKYTWYKNFLEKVSYGIGVPIYYSIWDLKRIIAWNMVSRLVGAGPAGSHERAPLLHQASRLLAEQESGWVVINDNKAKWTPNLDLSYLDTGATYFPCGDLLAPCRDLLTLGD